jgi:hypothetical protein
VRQPYRALDRPQLAGLGDDDLLDVRAADDLDDITVSGVLNRRADAPATAAIHPEYSGTGLLASA